MNIHKPFTNFRDHTRNHQSITETVQPDTYAYFLGDSAGATVLLLASVVLTSELAHAFGRVMLLLLKSMSTPASKFSC